MALYNTDRARLGDVRFPLENATTDTVRVLDGLQHNVVAKWLDPLTLAEGPDAPRFGANADFLAYFGDGWNSGWEAGVIGSPPQFNGSGTSGWIWSNHEYLSNQAPTLTSAPTGQHLTLARFLRAAGTLANDVESDRWSQRDVDTYIRQQKRQLGGSWLRVVQDAFTGAWHLDRGAPNRRYDATSATRLRVTGTTLSELDHDDAGPLPAGVVAGIMANCSGAVTPWGTVITAEENVHYLLRRPGSGVPQLEQQVRHRRRLRSRRRHRSRGERLDGCRLRTHQRPQRSSPARCVRLPDRRSTRESRAG